MDPIKIFNIFRFQIASVRDGVIPFVFIHGFMITRQVITLSTGNFAVRVIVSHNNHSIGYVFA